MSLQNVSGVQFSFIEAIEILERTPNVLEAMIDGISDTWISNNEGDETWSPYDVLGHLIHGEKTDWVPRMEVILSDNGSKAFEPFDRFAQFEQSKGKSIRQLLDEFKALRMDNIEQLRKKGLSQDDLKRTGIHPAFGSVTLIQLLASWVVHDLNHVSQISRVMAKQYETEVGPWKAYLGILGIRQ